MTQYSRPSPNLYVCSDGYSVEVLGQTGLAYREKQRCMFIDSEVLMPPAGIVIYRDTVGRWLPPNQEESVSSDERQRIVSNVLAVLGSYGIDVQVI